MWSLGVWRWELRLQDDHISTPSTFCTYWLGKSPFFVQKLISAINNKGEVDSTFFREIKEFFQPKALSEYRWIVVDMSTEGITEGDNSHVFPVFWLPDFSRALALVRNGPVEISQLGGFKSVNDGRNTNSVPLVCGKMRFYTLQRIEIVLGIAEMALFHEILR